MLFPSSARRGTKPCACPECSNIATGGHIYDHVRMFSFSSDTSSRATSHATSFRTERPKPDKTCPAAEVITKVLLKKIVFKLIKGSHRVRHVPGYLFPVGDCFLYLCATKNCTATALIHSFIYCLRNQVISYNALNFVIPRDSI